MRRTPPKDVPPPLAEPLEQGHMKFTRKDWVKEAKFKQPGGRQNGDPGTEPTQAQVHFWNLSMLTALGLIVDEEAPPEFLAFLRAWSEPMARIENPIEKNPNGLVRELYEVLKKVYG